MFASAPIQYAFDVPIQTAQMYINSRKSAATNGVLPANILPVLKGLHKLVLALQNQLLHLTKTDAMPLYSQIQPLQPLILAVHTEIQNERKIPFDKQERLIFKEFDTIFALLVSVFDEIHEIANDEIDENSLEFAAFWVDMMQKVEQTDLQPNGKRALHTQKDIDALFN